MWWPWTFLLKKRKRSNSDDGDGKGEPEDFPTEYEQHGMKEKGQRAQQLHRCDSQSKLCLDDMDDHIRKLKELKCRLKNRNGKARHECKEEG